MGSKTNISWTSATWNPVLGCSRVSEGCRNCYAETIAGRFGQAKQGKKPTVYDGLTQIVNGKSVWTGKIVETRTLLLPLQWKTPKRIFVNSMSDLFHENVTDEQRDRIFAVMALAYKHTFQVLTKRPERMLEYLTGDFHEMSRRGAEDILFGSLTKGAGTMGSAWPYSNVWMGVSVEDARVNHRIDTLREVPAAVRFLSLEPLIGDIGILDLTGISWVIVGGESGPHARPMLSQWATSIREQCEAAGVAYFHKQNGEWIDAGHDEFGKLPSGKIKLLHSDGTEWDTYPFDENADVITMKRVGRKRAGDTLYGNKYHEYPAC